MSCGVGCRCGSDPALLWLWCRLVATAPIRHLAWEPPYAMGAALEKAKRQKKKKKRAGTTAVTVGQEPRNGRGCVVGGRGDPPLWMVVDKRVWIRVSSSSRV